MFSEEFWNPISISIRVSLISIIVVTILGILLGKWMSNRRFRGKTVVETIILFPVVLPPTVIGFLLIIFFGKSGFGGIWIESIFNQSIMFTWVAAVIAASVVAFPFMYQSAKTGFEGVDHEIEDAARVDGAGEWKLFYYVTFPLGQKAIISGIILSFARALGEFGATFMFAGNIPGKTQTIPTAIYLAFESGNMRMAWMYVISIIIFSFILLASLRRFQRE
ncbi:molybdate ABC transporter permease subunit [Bacillus massilinigeriensis]|uniref:molybdate ABC transporter permease subunit n=1 Tax=Bacillus massilionigeriensis TaxID=1805475 RepID=UPI00096B1E63|nr:molybdate ABC transporter permease subunit [Bacillus massilionigeriensis]